MEDAHYPKMPEVDVTPEMLQSGIDELRQHSLGGDWKFVIECIYRAMFYESIAASSIKDSK